MISLTEKYDDLDNRVKIIERFNNRLNIIENKLSRRNIYIKSLSNISNYNTLHTRQMLISYNLDTNAAPILKFFYYNDYMDMEMNDFFTNSIKKQYIYQVMFLILELIQVEFQL